MSDIKHPATVAIVGAGLVGCLNAIYFAQRGWNVVLYEHRKDMRLPEEKINQRGRSINLAVSERGLSALRKVDMGLEEIVLGAAVPMRARMVHLGKDTQTSQAYSVHGEHINAVDRGRLNELLLNVVGDLPNVRLGFEHHLLHANLENGTMEFSVGPEKIKVFKTADLVIGTDGAYSKTRSQMMRSMRMQYSQEYIDTAYCELSMPPAKDEQGNDTYALDPNHLHIWPRHTFMLIALPNLDHSFTCTLFMPFEMFESINTSEKLLEFFQENFPDSIPLIGTKRLVEDYFANQKGSLINIKTSPHNFKDKALILGDAAHAMVPFYGQGMNCGFQDVEVLHEILDKHNVLPSKHENGKIDDLEAALDEYSRVHVKDTHAICDLALYNHYEMQSAVTSVRYLARKKLEGILHIVMPRVVIPLYTMVSFTTMPYSQAIQRWNRQSFWLNTIVGTMAIGTVTAMSYFTVKNKVSVSVPDIIQSVAQLSGFI
ncbi:hypothetical protein J3Q64DRAFT_1771239 [Phycomyces blakesleeanus]|uniref:Kynurenine 3-monooxygenase n=1 Tax=Phycomyces blakesleeanus TaxID=4837 RepID=A0ABR3AL85_PHYBL